MIISRHALSYSSNEAVEMRHRDRLLSVDLNPEHVL